MLENATYDDKRFLLDMLDVQVQLCRREDGRWLYVTCGIVAETGCSSWTRREPAAAKCKGNGLSLVSDEVLFKWVTQSKAGGGVFGLAAAG